MKNIETIHSNPIIKDLIHLTFSKIDESSSSFSYWLKDFKMVHGELNTQKTKSIEPIESAYSIIINDKPDLFKLIYALETSYVSLVKFIAFKGINEKTDSNFRIDSIINGTYFTEKGIINFSTKKYFNWLINDQDLREKLKILLKVILSEYQLNLEIDSIKLIYENIFIKQIRHSMGEYFTPDWMAKHIINNILYDDEYSINKSFLDPSCGSGTFIFNVIQQFAKENNTIFQNIYGIDLNPVSVLAAKANYLLLYVKYLGNSANFNLKIPIYYADTIQSKFSSNNDLFTNEVENDYEEISIPKVDYVIGNPPWVNWEYLPNEYRRKTKFLWQHYGLFSQKGMNAGFIKEDISVLFTYVVADKFLKNDGNLIFVVKETLFKSVKQGEGFRRFKIIPTNTPLNPYLVEDLSLFKPFNGAVNRTAIVYLKKGEELSFPVNYLEWMPLNGKKSLENNFDLNNLKDRFKFIKKKAQPSNVRNPLSGWISTEESELEKIKFVLGKSHYKARTGVFTGGANGIFWLSVLNDVEDKLLVQNITHRAKNKMESIEKELEKEYVFPFLTGRDLTFWSYTYSKYILCPHTRKSKMYPITKKELSKLPLTKDYLEFFQNELIARKGFTSFDKHIQIKSYYALQRIGDYTFAPYKVAWRYISKHFTPAVIEYADDEYLGRKNIIPNEKIIFIGFEHKEEAYYVCGILSSNLYRKTIESFMVGTQITPSLLQRLNIPKFDITNDFHIRISLICLDGHKKDNDKNQAIQLINGLVEQLIINKPMLSLL